MGEDSLDRLIQEQTAYYRAVAPEYEAGSLDFPGGSELETALAAFCPSGDVLELACGPGTWTRQLLRYADQLTAVDASSEMLQIAADRVKGDGSVNFVEADLFRWQPTRTYDAVFFGFWLSHVPVERFGSFWDMVAACVGSSGRVFFADDAYRTADELIEGESSSTIRRQLQDGTAYRAIKVPHTREALQAQLSALGWDIEVHQTAGPFYYGHGARA